MSGLGCLLCQVPKNPPALRGGHGGMARQCTSGALTPLPGGRGGRSVHFQFMGQVSSYSRLWRFAKQTNSENSKCRKNRKRQKMRNVEKRGGHGGMARQCTSGALTPLPGGRGGRSVHFQFMGQVSSYSRLWRFAKQTNSENSKCRKNRKRQKMRNVEKTEKSKKYEISKKQKNAK